MRQRNPLPAGTRLKVGIIGVPIRKEKAKRKKAKGRRKKATCFLPFCLEKGEKATSVPPPPHPTLVRV